MRTLTKEETKELLVRCWMTHDGLWFYHAVQEVGIEKTSKINQAAARAIGAVEARRIARTFGVEKVARYADLRKLVESGFNVIRGDFMDYTWDWSAENRLHITTTRCFAYDGIKKMGQSAIDGYDCGIFARVSGWFDGLGIAHKIDPPLTGCMLHREGSCHRDFEFGFCE